MKAITKNLFESLTDSTSGNTIKEYTMNYLDGYIDNDVTDTEIDMMVAFCFDFNETPKDSYDEFMNILGQRTRIVKVHDSEYGATLECDFSSVFKPYNEQLKEFFNMDNSEFDEDEAYYEAVDNLEALISGNAGESTYKELNDILKSNVINEGAELESGNDFDEIASYMYKDASNQVEYIPSIDEMDYIADVTEEEYKKLYDAVKTAIENVEGHFYNGMIELSDRATMNSLNTIEDESKYDDANQTYAELRDKALEDFTTETGVGIWQDGRSGKHIVVEDDYYNARDYAKLCDIQEKYENKVIDEFNKIYSNESVNESEELNSHKMNSVKYKTDGYTEATDGYYKGKPIVNYKEKDFKKGTSVLMPFICSNCNNEFYIKSNIHDFFEQGDFDDPYETPKDDLRCPKCKERDIDYNGEVLIKEPGVKINESEDLAIYTDFSNFPNEVAKGETPEERKNIFYRCYVSNPKEDEMNKWTIKDLVEYIKETDEYYNKDYKYIFKCCLLCGLTKEEAKELCGEKLNESAKKDANSWLFGDCFYKIYDLFVGDGLEDIPYYDLQTRISGFIDNIKHDDKKNPEFPEFNFIREKNPTSKDYNELYDELYKEAKIAKIREAYENCDYSVNPNYPTISDILEYLDLSDNSENRKEITDIVYKLGYDWQIEESTLTESVDEESLAKFIKDSVEKLQNSNYTNCKYNLDDKYAVFVGWSDGYEAEETNEYEIHSKENPTYCINAIIGIRNDADWADFDSIKRPYYEAGDVFEGEWTVSPHEDYTYLANSILKTYSYMLDLINSGELLTEDVSIDNDPDLNREQVNADVDYRSDVDEANTEDVFGREPVGVYTVSNTQAIYVYDIKHDIDDMVLAGDSSDTTKAKWRYINYEDLTDEETGEPIPFFYYGDIKVPLNEVVRTNI